MSILSPVKDSTGKVIDVKVTPLTIGNRGAIVSEKSPYAPTPEERDALSMVLQHFTLGYMNMYKPRVEFNDLSVIQRMQLDQMSFNTYQANNGDAFPGDEINSWKSRAMRPIVRNKCISIAAHATARLIFPKIFAYDDQNDSQEEAAEVMEGLMEWAADRSGYSIFSLYRTIAALTDPASIGYTEYAETYRKVKRQKDPKTKKYVEENMLDESMSGFQNILVPCDELFIENFYEPDVQKQAWLVWRKVISYSLAETKYSKYENFKKYVKPGVQIILNDANQSFYQVYDTNMRPYDVEEITYWNRNMDLKLILVNGVLLTESDNPNPRNDKLYPFDKFGYEPINNRCFYYKSLAFKMMQDANIINTLYPMIIDGTYLNLMPPMVNVGGEAIGSDVIVPGAVTTLADKDADLRAISLSTNLRAGQDTLFKVEESINQSSQDPIQAGLANPGVSPTATQLNLQQQNAATVLGLFIQMISQHVRDFGKLRLGDILQYLTIADADKIGDVGLVYKTFLLPKNSARNKVHKIVFDGEMSNKPISSRQQLNQSYDVLQEEGGGESDLKLYRANPELARNLIYTHTVDSDVLNPRSEELERAFNLETYDKLVQNPLANQEEALTLLLEANPKTKKNPKKYMQTDQQLSPLQGGVPALQ